MSTVVTYPEQLDELPEGGTVVVRMNDAGGGNVTWTKVGDMFTDGDSMIPSSGFERAVARGSVFLPGDHSVGDRFNGVDGFFYKIIGREGRTWVLAKTDSTGSCQSTSIVKEEPLGSPREAHPALDQAFTLMETLYKAQCDAERLAYIMERGEVPPEVTYRVSVEVKGRVEVAPSEAAARRMVGDNQVTIANVGTMWVDYSKTVSVTKTSRWGCACELVTAEDLDGQAPGEVTGWSVAECADEQGKSEAHAAPEEGAA